MEIRKSSIEQAKADFNEIKDFALKQAMKEVENKLTPKLDQMINAALSESVSIEAGEVKIEVPTGQDIKVSKEDGSAVTISGDASGSEAPVSDETIAEPIDNSDEEGFEIEDMEDEEEIEDNSDESDEDGIEIDMDGDMDDDSEDNEFIIGDENEEETLAEAEEVVIDAAPAPAEPTPDQTQDNNMTEDPISNPFEAIMQKLEAIETKIGGAPSEDGQVEIVDDEAAPAAPAADPAAVAPAPTPEEAPVQEEFLLEMDDEVMLPGEEIELDEEIVAEIIDDSVNEIELDEYNELQPNMIPGGEDDQNLDEMLGLSHTVRNQANRKNEINESKIKAQYESSIDELTKENGNLKDMIMEYKNSFIELRNQFNEMQTFNAKLAYANKLFINGGLSTDEKMKISEQFDKVKTIEEAKDLFRNIVKENTSVNPTKKTAEDKIKSPISAAVAKPEPLFESKESKRWRLLGGITKESEE